MGFTLKADCFDAEAFGAFYDARLRARVSRPFAEMV